MPPPQHRLEQLLRPEPLVGPAHGLLVPERVALQEDRLAIEAEIGALDPQLAEAEALSPAQWRLSEDAEPIMRALGERTYIIKRIRAVEHGVQATLRDRLRYLYKCYDKQHYIDLDDREDWEYMYQQYHALGKNGVMDDTRKKLLALPTEPPKKGG